MVTAVILKHALDLLLRASSVAGMGWFSQVKDLIGIMIATFAVILSLTTVLIQKKQQQRDAYRQVYDVLMSPELHRGRWTIVDIGKGMKIPGRDSTEFFLVYRTLGVFDALATYTRHRIVPRSLVLKVWRHPLLDMREGAEIVRRCHEDWKPWTDLWWLFDHLGSPASPTLPAAGSESSSGRQEP
jgi:hypothetical protein